MSSGCGDVLSLADLQTAKKHQLFEAEVITGKQGGVAGGADIDYATNQVTGQSQKTLPAVLRDAGFRPASFDFATGGTLGVNDRDKVVYDPISKTWYSWGGTLPHVIAAGTNPLLDSNWIPQTDPNLRTDLSGKDGLKFIGKCSSISDLRTINNAVDGQLIMLDAYRTNSGKGGGVFQWHATALAADDGGVTIAATGAPTGRWIRQVKGRYTPEMYGADGTKANDPSAIVALLANQKYLGFIGTYYLNQEFVTNGHNVEGYSTGEYYGDGSKSKIIFFGGFSAPQATRNMTTKSSWKNMTFEPESWNAATGYEGTGLRVGRCLDAENCNWFKFKQYGMDLWASITTELVHYPYGSQFRSCRFEYNGFAGIRFTNGANNVQIYGGSCSWNGSPSYGVAPTDSSTGWDGIVIGNVTEAGVPPMDNEYDLQGNVIEGVDCSYNARFGFHAYYANQSIFNIGYSEANFGTVSSAIADVNITDVVACDINILVAQRGANIAVPEKGFGVARSCANYPNRIVVNGQFYGSGSKDSFNRYINYQAGKFANHPLSVGTVGNSGFRSWEGNDGSLESYADGGSLMLIRANAGPLPTATIKHLGTLWRDTSVGPNGVYMCVENAPGVYVWTKLN